MIQVLGAWSLSSADTVLPYLLCDTGQVNLPNGRFDRLSDWNNNTSFVGLL